MKKTLAALAMTTLAGTALMVVSQFVVALMSHFASTRPVHLMPSPGASTTRRSCIDWYTPW